MIQLKKFISNKSKKTRKFRASVKTSVVHYIKHDMNIVLGRISLKYVSDSLRYTPLLAYHLSHIAGGDMEFQDSEPFLSAFGHPDLIRLIHQSSGYGENKFLHLDISGQKKLTVCRSS